MDKIQGRMVLAGIIMVVSLGATIFYGIQGEKSALLAGVFFLIASLGAMYLIYGKGEKETLEGELFDAMKNEADNASGKKFA